MYLIAIVEDEAAFRRQLTEYLTQYQDEHQGEFKVTEFSDAFLFCTIRIYTSGAIRK